MVYATYYCCENCGDKSVKWSRVCGYCGVERERPEPIELELSGEEEKEVSVSKSPLFRSDLVSLTAATLFYPKRDGRHPAGSTVFRHCTRGVRGVKLESLRIGNKRYTSRAAVEHFFEQLAAQESEDARRRKGPRGGTVNKGRVEAAEAELKRRGL